MEIAELKARLSEYLVRDQAGEETVVTDRDRPATRLASTRATKLAEEVAQLRCLQRQGLVRVGTGVLPDAIWRLKRPEDPQGMVRAGLEAERAEGQ